MKKKKLLIILVPLLVFVLAFVCGITFAALNSKKGKKDNGVKVNIESTINVSASIVGRSYQNRVLIETIGPIVFDGSKDQDVDKSLNFNRATNITELDDEVGYVFTITNTTKETEDTDLIVAASCDIEKYDNVVIKFYYSINGRDYVELNERYLTIKKGNTMDIKLQISIKERTVDMQLNGTINIELFSEDGLPEGYKNDK